ncbi:MAG: response regulator, partial [Bacteroidota bacterium]
MPQPTILIVDDQPLIRMSLRSALTEFEVLEAGNGIEALEKVEKASVDLILLDLDLPGMDGTTTLSILKDSFETKRIPIIVVTSYDDVEEKIKCL